MGLKYERMDELAEELNKMDCYIPMYLQGLVVGFLDRATDEARRKFFDRRMGLQIAKDTNDYLKRDLEEWLNEHQEFIDMFEGIW